jgi:hypothetical protein
MSNQEFCDFMKDELGFEMEFDDDFDSEIEEEE